MRARGEFYNLLIPALCFISLFVGVQEFLSHGQILVLRDISAV